MSIINIIVRTFVLFVCGIFQIIGVVVEGFAKLLAELGNGLGKLDNKLMKQLDKKKQKTEEVPK